MIFFGSKEIKYHVRNLLNQLSEQLSGKVVVDVPAGSGESSHLLTKLGAKVIPMDIFPEFFKTSSQHPELKCRFADLSESIPLEDNSVDFVLTQEGIEHISDQHKLFKEFNRILKDHGTLVVTTPNYSNLRSRISYLLNESEYYKFMPPNEVESIWMAKSDTQRVYHGHIYMIGIQKLRLLAKLNGFNIQKIIPNKYNTTSLFIFLFLYPFILLFSFRAYIRALYKNKNISKEYLKLTFNEQFKLNISPSILCTNHLIVIFKKAYSTESVANSFKSKIHNFEEST